MVKSQKVGFWIKKLNFWLKSINLTLTKVEKTILPFVKVSGKIQHFVR